MNLVSQCTHAFEASAASLTACEALSASFRKQLYLSSRFLCASTIHSSARNHIPIIHQPMAVHLTEISTQSQSTQYGPWYSTNNAIKLEFRDHEEVFLLESGCKIPTGGWNCTSACIDPTLGPQLTWGPRNATTATVANCLQMPYIAYGGASGENVDPDHLFEKYNILLNANETLVDLEEG